ncbi:MAG: fructosamine kinase family protein [Bacteroidota bacterium]
MALPAPILADLEASFGLSVMEATLLSGGCIHHTHRIHTHSGVFFLKYNHAHQAHNFEVEVKGLTLLKAAQTIRVPEVIGTNQLETHAYILLEFIEAGRRGSNFWEALGTGLGQLHLHSAPAFGLDHDNYIGALPQSNQRYERWLDFFVEERIRPMLRMGVSSRKIPQNMIKDFDRLFQRLDHFFPKESPALIHGDLWGGNLLTSADGLPAVIDPAVYYGHREIELAFMTMFDSQPAIFYDAYQSIWPLESGWQDRFDLYNLYPLLVHVNLFGGGYLTSVRQVLRTYL